MVEILKNLLSRFLEYEFNRFLFIGSITVLIDFICYLFLMYLDFDTFFSKGVSFSIGAIFAYFKNRNYTFKSSKGGFFIFIIFILLYFLTLTVNVFSNEILIQSISQIKGFLIISFMIATSLSASLNFIGMKYIVFNVVQK